MHVGGGSILYIPIQIYLEQRKYYMLDSLAISIEIIKAITIKIKKQKNQINETLNILSVLYNILVSFFKYILIFF